MNSFYFSSKVILAIVCIANILIGFFVFEAKAKVSLFEISTSKMSEKIYLEMISWRQQIHENPELGFEEFRTTKMIENILKKMGFEILRKKGTTGLIARLNVSDKFRVVSYRAELDALPLTENTGLAFSSKTKHMHACGHDLNIAVLLATAKILAVNKKKLKTNVEFIFQPAEELTAQGSKSGAQEMIDLANWKTRKPLAIIGIHASSSHVVGQIVLNDRNVLSAIQNFQVSFEGSGGHIANLYNATNPILASSWFILELEKVKKKFPNSVIQITQINAGAAKNIIPTIANLFGTIRAENTFELKKINSFISDIIEKSQIEFKTKGLLLKVGESQPVVNNSEIVKIGREFLAKEKTLQILSTQPSFAGDDFSSYLQHVPGVYFLYGTSSKEASDSEKMNSGLHTSNYNPIEKSMLFALKANLIFLEALWSHFKLD